MTPEKWAIQLDRRKFLELTALTGSAVFVGTLPGCGTGGEDGAKNVAAGGGGFSQEGLSRMHDLMAGSVASGKVPGLVTLVSRGGEVHVDALGMKALGGAAPMERDTIFRISSMTKPITAVATIILVEEGKLRLDEPVDRLLPELADRKVLRKLDSPLDDTAPAKRPITVLDLLTFRMGFGIVFPLDTSPIQKAASALKLGQGPPQPQAVPEPNEWIRRLGTLPLMGQPGELWFYNTGSDVLGVLIARASGQPLETFFSERIFTPLGMKDTSFSVPAAKLDRLATSYWAQEGKGTLGLYDGVRDSHWSRPPAFPSGAAGLVSTVDDYLAFAQMLLNKGTHAGGRIISAQAVEGMTSDHLTPEQKKGSGFFPGYFDNRGWGFGVSMITKPDPVSPIPGRYGWDGGLGTSWFNDPGNGLIAILMTQRAYDNFSPAPDFWKAAYQALDG